MARVAVAGKPMVRAVSTNALSRKRLLPVIQASNRPSSALVQVTRSFHPLKSLLSALDLIRTSTRTSTDLCRAWAVRPMVTRAPLAVNVASSFMPAAAITVPEGETSATSKLSLSPYQQTMVTPPSSVEMSIVAVSVWALAKRVPTWMLSVRSLPAASTTIRPGPESPSSARSSALAPSWAP